MDEIDNFISSLPALVISRKPRQRIIIHDKLGEIIGVITVLSTASDKAKILIQFPDQYKIDREELFQAKITSNAILKK